MEENQTAINSNERVKVLFVCMGNICRSPTAHGVFRHLVKVSGLTHQIEIDSAGTHAYHIGNPPDERSAQTAKKRGIDLSDLRARKVDLGDLYQYDYVLAMDKRNQEILLDMAPSDVKHKIRLFLEFAPQWGKQEVPDPYYGGEDGFEHVFDLVQAASEGLLIDIRQRL
jgi:protein-tyrosine phosphatase